MHSSLHHCRIFRRNSNYHRLFRLSRGECLHYFSAGWWQGKDISVLPKGNNHSRHAQLFGQLCQWVSVRHYDISQLYEAINGKYHIAEIRESRADVRGERSHQNDCPVASIWPSCILHLHDEDLYSWYFHDDGSYRAQELGPSRNSCSKSSRYYVHIDRWESALTGSGGITSDINNSEQAFSSRSLQPLHFH